MLSARATPVELVRTVAAGVAVALLGATTTALTGDFGPSAQSLVQARVPALIAFVEAERGLPWKREVTVEVLGDEAFLEALYEPTGPDVQEDPGDVDKTLEALDLVPPGTDSEEAVGESLDSGVVGFYDGFTERLVVRAEKADAYVDLVIVHELTHALQDQHFTIDRPQLEDGTERSIAFSALVEGDATRVEQAWLAAQTPDAQAQVLDEEVRRFGEGEPVGLEDAIEGTLSFPYAAGLPLAESLAAEGQAVLDQAFRRPPVSTEQVLHPGETAPVAVPAPSGEGERVDDGVLGELGLAQLLGIDAREGGPQEGWAGGAYATYDDDGAVCTLAAVRMDDADLRDDLVETLRDVGYGAEPEGATALELRSCA